MRMKCADCGTEISEELNQTPYETDFGILCQKCFCKRLGDEIEKHPIGIPRELARKCHRKKQHENKN